MINLLTSASRYVDDFGDYNYKSTTDKLLSSLFDGFFFIWQLLFL